MNRFEHDLVAMLPQLRAFARHLAPRDSQLAEDLVQEACVNALRARAQFTPGTNMHAWLFTILRNCFLDSVKRASTRLEQPGDDLDHLTAGTVPQVGHLEFMALREAIARLSPEHREALLVSVLGQLSYRDIADRCRCEVGTVKSRVSRAREKLREELEHGAPVGVRMQASDGHDGDARHAGVGDGAAVRRGRQPAFADLGAAVGREHEQVCGGCPC